MSLNGLKQLARQLMTHRHHRPHSLPIPPAPLAPPSSVPSLPAVKFNARLLFTRSSIPILPHPYHYHPPPPRSPLTTTMATATTSADHPLNLDAHFKQKKALRSNVRRDLKSMDPTLRSKEDDAIQNIVLEAPWFKSCQKLCAYISCSALREVDTSKLLAQILNHSSKDDYLQVGKTLYVPRVEDKNSHMRMLKISSMDDLIANSMNILEPAPTDAEGKEREDVMLADHPLDLLLLPGLAFDKSGRRLGRGGGYYDSFLTRYQGLVKERKWKQPLLVLSLFKRSPGASAPTDEHLRKLVNDPVVNDAMPLCPRTKDTETNKDPELLFPEINQNKPTQGQKVNIKSAAMKSVEPRLEQTPEEQHSICCVPAFPLDGKVMTPVVDHHPTMMQHSNNESNSTRENL